jgi:hypothetical protein
VQARTLHDSIRRRQPMIRAMKISVCAAVALSALAAGCNVPDAIQRSQRLQLDAMVQYRTEMAAYHEKVKTRLVADKRRELDVALAASLAQAADAAGKVPVAVVTEKVSKRQSLEQEFLANVARLDGEFAQRQAAIDRAIDLAKGSLALINNYSQLGAAVKNLFVREVESTNLVNQYESEGSTDNAGTTGEPQASGS